MPNVILITGASSGFGLLTARALARAGHTVYASMLDPAGRNVHVAAVLKAQAGAESIDLRTVELDVTSDVSVQAAVDTVLADAGRLDVVVHNAGHMTFGPAEAFSTAQLAQLYDVNVLSTQRLNRAVLPHMRERRDGLIVWVSSSSVRGGVPPYLGPYFAAKAAMDQLAVSYAGELARFGVETSIIVPGAYTKGTNHFANAGHPTDEVTAEAYRTGPDADFEERILTGLAALEPADADAAEVAEAIVRVVDAPRGSRPFRVHNDPSQDGAEVVNGVADRMRAELLRRIGLADVLRVCDSKEYSS
jgi:NAD(P)-dependent dehydrogenase (short-subunit alcohol dehydrogenase family)